MSIATPDHGPSALMGVRSSIPEHALTAPLLGTERAGHAVRIRADGLAVTVGYLVSEAEQIWLTSTDGQASAAYLVALDHDSGLALLKPTLPLGGTHLVMAGSHRLAIDDPLEVLRSDHEPVPCKLVAKQEFAGRWEYLLDEALYTTPACEDWAGTALVDHAGLVYGIGSLMLEMPAADGTPVRGNLFVPLQQIVPHLDDLVTLGKRRAPPRPWLGSLIQEHDDTLVVVGIYPDCPASRAGIEPGDIVVEVNGTRPRSLADLLRNVRSLGPAGVEVPLTVSREGSLRDCRLLSIDRAAYYDLHAAGTRN